MPSSARNIGEAINEGVIYAGLTRYAQKGGGAEGKNAVERWLERTYPQIASVRRDSLIRAIEQISSTGRSAMRHPIDEQIKRQFLPDASAMQRAIGTKGNPWNHYAVNYRYEWTDDFGETHVTFRQKLFTGEGSWSRNQLLQQGLMNFESQMSYEKMLYKDKPAKNVWTSINDLKISMTIDGAWQEIPGG